MVGVPADIFVALIGAERFEVEILQIVLQEPLRAKYPVGNKRLDVLTDIEMVEATPYSVPFVGTFAVGLEVKHQIVQGCKPFRRFPVEITHYYYLCRGLRLKKRVECSLQGGLCCCSSTVGGVCSASLRGEMAKEDV